MLLEYVRMWLFFQFRLKNKRAQTIFIERAFQTRQTPATQTPDQLLLIGFVGDMQSLDEDQILKNLNHVVKASYDVHRLLSALPDQQRQQSRKCNNITLFL